MEVFVNVKSAGKRRPILDKKPYSLPDGIGTMEELVRSVVSKEVASYNAKEPDADLVLFLTEQQIEEGQEIGKIGFDRRFSSADADVDKATEAAIMAFEDGIWRFFINEAEIKQLSDEVNLKDGDVLTFIRLTFLSGRLW